MGTLAFILSMLGTHWKDLSSSRVRSIINARLRIVSRGQRVVAGRAVKGVKQSANCDSS